MLEMTVLCNSIAITTSRGTRGLNGEEHLYAKLHNDYRGGGPGLAATKRTRICFLTATCARKE